MTIMGRDLEEKVAVLFGVLGLVILDSDSTGF